jgi:hypothetical protein
MTKIAPALAIAIVLSLAMLTTVLAIDAPDTLTFEPAGGASSPAVTAYRDLLESGDMLVVGQYNIAYATLPVDGADVNFIGRALHSTSSVGVNVPYPYNDDGYGKGVISWYLTASTTADQGWYNDVTESWDEWSATLTDMGVDLSTNPLLFAAADQRTALDFPLDADQFSTGSGTATNQTQLASKIVNIARGLEAAWGVSLVNTNGRLNDTGGTYFQLAIPSVQLMAPDAFGSSSISPTIPTPMPTPGGPGTFAETAEDRFDGTWWLTPQFDLVSTTLSWPAGSFESAVSVLLIFGCAAYGWRQSGSTGGTYGLLLGAGVLLPFFTVLGFIGMAMGLLGLFMLGIAAIFKIAQNHLA